MADTGHLAIRGYKAAAIKYTALRGFVPNPSASTLNACLVSRGFGNFSVHHLPSIRGYSMPPSAPTNRGAFEIFTGGIFGVPGMTS